MGIKSLTQVINECAPAATKENEMKNYFGRKVAMDATMNIYQFLIAVRQTDGGSQLTNESGEVTSHLMGIFYRTIRMLENGLKPVYVFDGKPPELKSGELEKRAERREEAARLLEKASEEGDSEQMEKMNKRLVKCTKQHVTECQKLLRLMGVPIVEAPGEAEAQCAELVKAGKVYAVGTEDMDALTFGAKVLLRHLSVSEAKKMPVKEFHLDRVLEGLNMDQKKFIDLCILLGCDYCETIRGVGPKRAVELIKKHGDIDTILKHLDTKKYPVPDGWLYEGARKLFITPDVTPGDEIELKWKDPDVEGIVAYMCTDKGFGEDRIRTGIKRIQKSRSVQGQGRLDSFFSFSASSNPKRKADDSKKGKSSAKKTKKK